MPYKRRFSFGSIMSILQHADQIHLIISVLFAVASSYTKRSSWCKLLSTFNKIDKILANKKSKFEQNIFKNINKYLLVLGFSMFTVICWFYSIWYELPNQRITQILCLTVHPVITFVLVMYFYLEILVMVILLLALKARVKTVQKLIINLKSENYCTNLSAILQKVDYLTLQLYEITKHFKLLFEFQYYIMIAYFFCACLYLAHFIHHYFAHFITVLWCFILMVSQKYKLILQ